MPRKFTFEADKALEAILYIAGRVPSPTFHTVSKVLYFADQKHLSAFGRLLFGDSYVAMKHGPVPSGAYDMMRWVKSHDVGSHRGIPDRLVTAFEVVNAHQLAPRREPDLSYLSKSDRAALDWSISEFGGKTFKQLTDASHDAAWDAAPENDMIELSDIVAMLPNSEELAEHLELQD